MSGGWQVCWGSRKRTRILRGWVWNPTRRIVTLGEKMNKIILNDTELLSGDPTSMGVIYNNIIGQNFSGDEYKKYMDWIEWKTDTKIKGNICLQNVKGEVLKQQAIA